MVDASFSLERESWDLELDPYNLEGLSDVEDDSSVIFDIPEETMGAPLGSGSESDPLEYDLDLDEVLEDPDKNIPGSSPRGYDGSDDGDLPAVITQLQKELLNGYLLPPCPSEPPELRSLSRAETLSLKHYLAWTESHGTVKAYNSHAQVLAEATMEEILSLYKVKQLAMTLTGLKPFFVEMCPRSCMAFTGKFKDQSTCSYSHNGKD
jgi:hypothetical protein